MDIKYSYVLIEEAVDHLIDCSECVKYKYSNAQARMYLIGL